MPRATGLGGVFLRAADPDKLHAWYEEHFGIKRTEGGAFAFFPMDNEVLRSHRTTSHAQSKCGRPGTG